VVFRRYAVARGHAWHVWKEGAECLYGLSPGGLATTNRCDGRHFARKLKLPPPTSVRAEQSTLPLSRACQTPSGQCLTCTEPNESLKNSVLFKISSVPCPPAKAPPGASRTRPTNLGYTNLALEAVNSKLARERRQDRMAELEQLRLEKEVRKEKAKDGPDSPPAGTRQPQRAVGLGRPRRRQLSSLGCDGCCRRARTHVCACVLTQSLRICIAGPRRWPPPSPINKRRSTR